MSKPTDREQARREGATFYYTGRPCRRGHVGARLTSNGGCKQCRTERLQKLTAEDHAKQRGQSLNRYETEQGSVRFQVHNLKM